MLRSMPPVIATSNSWASEPVDGGVHRRQRGRARRVGREVRPVEVEQVGDPAGDAVAELAGHRVLGDRRAASRRGWRAARPRSRRARPRAARRSSRCRSSSRASVGEHDAQRRQVVLLARQGVADDHGGAIEVERPIRPAGVDQRHPRARDAPTSGRRPSRRSPSAGSAASSRAGPTPSRAPSRRSSSTCCSGRLRVGVVVERPDPSARDRRR